MCLRDSVRRDLELDWGGDYETSFVNPDFAKMAETYGAKGITVNDPTKVNEAIEEAIEKIILDGDLQKTMSEKSLIQSKQFSWDKTAQQTEEVYAKVLGL